MSDSPRRPLQRSRSDRMVAGVCGGIAAVANIDPTIVRLLAVLIILSSMGTGLAIYLILALVMPLELDRSGSLPGASFDGSASLTAASDDVPAALTAASEEPAFTPDEVKRWDLPGTVAVAPPAGNPASAAAEAFPPATQAGG